MSTRGASNVIYVRLLNEGVDAWAPAPARSIVPGVYEIIKPDDYNPDAEEWEFVPGTVVECEERVVGERRIIAAVRRARPAKGGSQAPPQS